MEITDEYLNLKHAELNLRLKGYALVSRSRYNLVIRKNLTESEFFLLTFIWDVLADWDDRHLNYGLFELDFELFGYLISWNPSKLRRKIKNLIKKNFIKHVSQKTYAVVGFALKKMITKKSKEFNFYQELIRTINNFKNTNPNSENNKK